MGRQLLTMGYYLFAMLVGFGVFVAFFVFLFSLDDGFLSERNPMRAFWSATGGIGGVAVYLLLGRLIFGSYKHVATTLGTIFISSLLAIPVYVELSNHLY